MNKEQVIELQKNIFGGIFSIANKLQTLGDEFLGEVTTKQWFLCIIINEFFKDRNPSLSEVAEIMGTSRQNVKQIVLKLEKIGFLEIKKDEKDSRVLRVTLTERCNKYFESRSEKSEEFLKNIFNNMEAVELIQMFNSLDKFNKNILSLKMED